MKKILLRVLTVIGITVAAWAVAAAGLFAIYRWFLTHPNVPRFYVETLAEFEDATEKDGFIAPDLGRYEGFGNFDYMLCKKNGMWAGKRVLYGKHTGYEIYGAIVPRTDLWYLRVAGYEHRPGDGERLGEGYSLTRYGDVEIAVGYWDSEVRDDTTRYDSFLGRRYPVGTAYRRVYAAFDFAGCRYDVSGHVVFEDGEPGGEGAEALTDAAIEEMMVIIRGIIDVGVGG